MCSRGPFCFPQHYLFISKEKEGTALAPETCKSVYRIGVLRRRELYAQQSTDDTEPVALFSYCIRIEGHPDLHAELNSVRRLESGTEIGVWHVWTGRPGEDYVKCAEFCKIPLEGGGLPCRLFDRHAGLCQGSSTAPPFGGGEEVS